MVVYIDRRSRSPLTIQPTQGEQECSYFIMKSVVGGDRSCAWPDGSGYLVIVCTVIVTLHDPDIVYIVRHYAGNVFPM